MSCNMLICVSCNLHLFLVCSSFLGLPAVACWGCIEFECHMLPELGVVCFSQSLPSTPRMCCWPLRSSSLLPSETESPSQPFSLPSSPPTTEQHSLLLIHFSVRANFPRLDFPFSTVCQLKDVADAWVSHSVGTKALLR